MRLPPQQGVEDMLTIGSAYDVVGLEQGIDGDGIAPIPAVKPPVEEPLGGGA